MDSALRLTGGVLVLLGGAIHLQQWLTVFRDLDIGPALLGNAVMALVVGVALFTFDHPVPAIAGIALSLGSLAALAASRTIGLLGFEAAGYETPEVTVVVIESLTVVPLAVYLGRQWVRRRQLDARYSR